MVGRCEQCEKECVSPAHAHSRKASYVVATTSEAKTTPANTATCHCRSTALIHLKPALQLNSVEVKRLAELATKFGVTVPEVVAVALSLGLQKIKHTKVREVIALKEATL